MAVPANVTASITALENTAPTVSYIPGAVEAVVGAQLKAAMLATGTVPTNLPDIIRAAMDASRASQIETLVRRSLLAELRSIQAAG